MHTERVLLITGANRGIGFTLTQFFLREGERVIATARHPETADALRDLQHEYGEKLSIAEFDAINPHASEMLTDHVSETYGHIDWLINNAAIYKHAVLKHHDDECSSFGAFTSEALTQMMTVNAVAPLMLAQDLHPLLEKSQDAKIVNISSGMGSISQNDYVEHMGYCMSKAALNMVTKKLAAFYEKYRIPVIAVSPGWVRTDMGGPGAELSVEESCESLVKFINNLSFAQSGGFFRRDGATIPW